MNNKWRPFDALTSSSELKHDIATEKTKIEMPILSEEQLQVIEQSILDSYQCKNEITITYYKGCFLENIKGLITSINPYSKLIIICNKRIYFNQIIATK